MAEFQIFGTPAPNPDLAPTAISWSPSSPVETDSITVSTTVTNIGTADLIGTAAWTPSNPAGGNPVAFTVTLKN